MLEVVLGALFTLICGSFAYTHASTMRLFELINTIKTNHLAHVAADLKKIVERLDKLEKRPNGK